MFQHSNASVQKERTIKTCLAKVGVEKLKWPALNPDLIPLDLEDQIGTQAFLPSNSA